ncbi:hypothetical protein ACFLVN_00005, partial [Chloroflexota bacterium]
MGDEVTIYLTIVRGMLKHFTVHDEAHSQATSTTAAHFLYTTERRIPFPMRAIHLDGDPEFETIFEEECHWLA